MQWDKLSADVRKSRSRGTVNFLLAMFSNFLIIIMHLMLRIRAGLSGSKNDPGKLFKSIRMLFLMMVLLIIRKTANEYQRARHLSRTEKKKKKV